MDRFRARAFADELGLFYSGDDWGRNNGDGARLLEFIGVWNERRMWSDVDLADGVLDLIVASANGRILAGGVLTLEEQTAFSAVIRRVASQSGVSLEPWLGLLGHVDFPVAAMVADAARAAG